VAKLIVKCESRPAFLKSKANMNDDVVEMALHARTPDGDAEGFLYHPDAKGPWPGVLFYTDIGGIRQAPRGQARRLASEGYSVLVPNLFYRTSSLPVFTFKINLGDERTTRRFAELSAPLTPEAMDRDAAAYVDFLAARLDVAKRPMGVVGYCYSGTMAMRTAAVRPDKIEALASFHAGRLPVDAPASPHLLLPKIKARLYFGHAVEDRSMPEEAVKKFEEALRTWGGKYESETYASAFHGWTMTDSPVYNQPQAERAFGKLTELLSETLKTGS
jgi:carboxymethylenebutenolidase